MPSLLPSLQRSAWLLATAPGQLARRAVARYRLAEAVHLQAGPLLFWCERSFEDEALALVGHLAEALNLIHEVDEGRHERILTNAGRFFIIDRPGACYWIEQNIIVLPVAEVRKGEPFEIAIRIIHEAAHARICQAGIPWVPDLFQRIEARCVKEEIAFCIRLQRSGWRTEERVAWLTARLERQLYNTIMVRSWLFFILSLPLSLPQALLFRVLALAEEDHRKAEFRHGPPLPSEDAEDPE